MAKEEGSGSHNSKYGSLHTSDSHEETSGPSCCRSALCMKYFPAGYVKILKPLFTLAAPIILTLFLQYSISLMAVIFCGQLGKTELDAVSLANSLIIVTGISIAEGLCTACDTFFSQTFTSNNKHKLGILLQRSIYIVLIALLPCWAIHLNTEGLLLLMGQDPEVSRLTGEYMLIYMPGIFFFFVYMCLEKYVQCQDIVIPNFVVAIICNVINAGLHYLLVYALDYRTNGSAIAQVITHFCLFAFTLGYIIAKGIYKSNWSGFSTDALRDWGIWVKLGLYGLLMVCIEWWSFEIGNFMAGILGTTDLGAQSVIVQCESFAFMVPMGFGIAASIQIGHYLGAGDSDSAKTASRVVITIMYCFGVFWAVIFVSLRDYLPHIFTSDIEVINYASKVLPLLGVYMLFNTFGVMVGILRGCGRQKTGFICVVIVYPAGLAIGLPLMFLTWLRVAGFWIGLASALVIMNVICLFIVLRTDWDEQVRLAAERTIMDYDEPEEEEYDELYNSNEESALLHGGRTRTGSSGSKRSISSRNTSVSRPIGRAISTDLGVVVTVGAEDTSSKASLILRRLPVLLVALSILLGGILVRVWAPLPQRAPECQWPGEWNNSTLPWCNGTTTDVTLVANFTTHLPFH